MTADSRGSGMLTLERVLRGVAVAALLIALARSLWPAAGTSRDNVGITLDATRADSGVSVARTIGNAIAAQAASGAAATSWPTLAAQMQVIPSDTVRAILGASANAGVPVSWRDSTGARSLAIDARAASSPQTFTLIDAAGSTASARASAIVLRDQGGVVDSAPAGRDVLRVRAARVRGDLRATLTRDGKPVATARVTVPDSARMGRVLLFAQPGWEAKFVTAALEESGWIVDGSLALAPKARIRTGSPGTPDTSRYAAVVVLDSGVTTARDLRRFIAQGGGVVIAGGAVRDPALATLASIRVAGHRPALPGALLTDQPRRGLAALHLSATRASLTLERDGANASAQPVVVVERQGVGRVLASGYQATWHWRMEGRDESADEHRRWWDGLVGAVAYAGAAGDSTRVARQSRWPGDAAPVADLVARLGPASTNVAPSLATRPDLVPSAWLLYIIAVVSLLTEWALRRLRGAP